MPIVNLRHVDCFLHGPSESGEVHPEGRDERLAVGRSVVHLFRPM